MATPRSTRATAPGWHHGNLLPALVDAADALVAEGGRGAVSFRSVAARVSETDRVPLSHTAAMAHVGSITELLAHVSARWWRHLLESLDRTAKAEPVPADRLQLLAKGYRRFAATSAHQFRVMYDEAIWRAVGGAFRTAGERRSRDAADTAEALPAFKRPEILEEIRGTRDLCFGCFYEAVVDGMTDGSLRTDRPAYHMARSIAALAHGLAMEALDERLPEGEVSEVVELAVEGLLRER